MNNRSDKMTSSTSSTSSISRLNKVLKHFTRNKIIMYLIIFAGVFSFFQPEIAKNILDKVWLLIY